MKMKMKEDQQKRKRIRRKKRQSQVSWIKEEGSRLKRRGNEDEGKKKVREKRR